MSEFIEKLKEKADAVSAAIDNELTVLEGAGGDDPLAHHDDTHRDDTAEAGDA